MEVTHLIYEVVKAIFVYSVNELLFQTLKFMDKLMRTWML